MYSDGQIWIGNSGENKIVIYPKMANRHGMIAGATGTGKTTTVKVLAESFSDAGVPVFLADVKGDLAGICKKGEGSTANADNPVNFWDVYGEKGMPLRTTITEMGPILLSRILGLNQTQSEIMTVVFKIADDEGLLLIDTKDLRSMLNYVGENAKAYSLKYGNITQQSLAAIIRSVIALESEGGEKFFGEPALDIRDWFGTNCDGKGNIQVLDCQKLILNPTMYSTLLLWMMSELYEILPEVGDLDKPRMVFFFDEAHMLFDTASKTLLDKIEQIVKLIRSKGVGIYFITQSPKDIPDAVLAQLGNKVQHALHAYTPSEQKTVKAAAESFRANPEFNTFEVLQELTIGEAIVSVLDESGTPTVAQKCKVMLPNSTMSGVDDDTRRQKINSSLLLIKYQESIDRDSAYEFLLRRAEDEKEAVAAAKEEEEARKQASDKKAEKEAAAEKKKTQKVVKSVANAAVGTIGREVGNNLGKSIGGSFGKRIGGNVGASLCRGIIGTLFK